MLKEKKEHKKGCCAIFVVVRIRIKGAGKKMAVQAGLVPLLMRRPSLARGQNMTNSWASRLGGLRQKRHPPEEKNVVCFCSHTPGSLMSFVLFFYCCCSRPLFGRYCVPGRGEGEGCSFSGFQQDWSVFLQQMLLSGGLGDVEVVYGGEVSVRIRAGRCFFTETLIVIYCERHSYGKITEVINISGFFLEVD